MRRTCSTRRTERGAARAARGALAVLVGGFWAASCGFDSGSRWEVVPSSLGPICEIGAVRCRADALESCLANAATGDADWFVTDDCGASGLICSSALGACATCNPGDGRCSGQVPERCSSDGAAWEQRSACDGTPGSACRAGGCVDLCGLAASQRSNVGCEYWAADLDNANVGVSLNAASQQFAVVVSNAQPDIIARVTIERDDTAPGDPSAPVQVAAADVPPLSLRVFKLGPREVDGSAPGEFDTGTHTALTRAAYRITSDVPVVAYQFNPLENVNVFSNDASLLKPVEALANNSGQLSNDYVVLGWPQTIASTEDPDTNFNPANPIDLRGFLTIVATRPDTTVRVEPTTRVLGDGAGIAPTEPGDSLEVKLQPFDVLNLETDDFNADFTGSLIYADQPLVVFSGSEASDAPFFETLATRQCCADHLEEQLDPVRTAGRRFVATVGWSRTRAVSEAGATVGVVEQVEYYRVIAVTDAGATVNTTLDGADRTFTLDGKGDFADLAASRDFTIDASAPIMVGNISPSQNAAGIPRGLPGGDPSFIVLPPVEQHRPNYVFLTPDKYSFDFIRIVAPPDTTVVLDGRIIVQSGNVVVDPLTVCERFPGDGLTEEQRGSPLPPFFTYRCQLSFPVIDPQQDSNNLLPGSQNDGVHRLDANRPVGVLVDGFDAFVSYAYAAGTELVQIVPE